MKNTKLGIIGGGQLGMLLVQSAIQFPVYVAIFDPDEDCAASSYTNHFVRGDFEDYEAVLNFGLQHDAVIFETEKTNVQALLELQRRGITVVSSPQSLQWIQDKGMQKEKLQSVGIPVVPSEWVAAGQIRGYTGKFPVVQKWCTGGYDGYGVAMHLDASTLKNAKEVDSIFEHKVAIWKEISIMLARDKQGSIALYPAVEMVFDPDANLVDYLIAPARLEPSLTKSMEAVCMTLAEKLDLRGVYAVEFFVDQDQTVFVNEISPRPHNSGHHTVSGNITSQYEQQVRIALGLPLGSTEQITPCVLVNLLAENVSGTTQYEGLREAYQIPNVQYTLYGKQQVRPRRKMGHAVILEKSLETALERMRDIRNTLRITAYE